MNPQSIEIFPQVVRNYLKDLGIFTDNVDTILTNLENGSNFPKNNLHSLADSGIYDVHFFRLLFLSFHLEKISRAAENADKATREFMPFTRKQRKSFENAKRKAKITKFFLKWYVSGVIFLFFLLFPWVGYVALSSIPLAASISITITGSVISALGLAYAGLYITGIFPDISSRKANEAQNHSRALHTSYRYMSQRLLELYAHSDTKSLAEEIAMYFNKYNRKILKNRMLTLLSKSIVNQLIHSLKEVHMFIREGSRNTALLNPDLTTHWLTLESNSFGHPARACDLNVLFRPRQKNDNTDSSNSQFTNSYTSLEFEEV